MDNNLVINIEKLHFKRQERSIFAGVDIQLPRGKIVAIMGPSGSGKTTLLRLIGRQLMPEQGRIEVFGQDLSSLSQKNLYKIRRRMGLLFQNGALFTNLSVYENVAFPLRELTDLNESMIRDIVLLKLQAVGLRGAHELMPSQLSGGMSRRVALARAIALDPEIIMYDEPFAGQDPITKGVLVTLIKKLNTALHVSTIIVSHDVQETLSIADYAYLIANGKVIAEGSPTELYATKEQQVVQFLQGLPDGPVPFHYPAPPLLQDLFEE